MGHRQVDPSTLPATDEPARPSTGLGWLAARRSGAAPGGPIPLVSHTHEEQEAPPSVTVREPRTETPGEHAAGGGSS
jgi:hypothetical protein